MNRRRSRQEKKKKKERTGYTWDKKSGRHQTKRSNESKIYRSKKENKS